MDALPNEVANGTSIRRRWGGGRPHCAYLKTLAVSDPSAPINLSAKVSGGGVCRALACEREAVLFPRPLSGTPPLFECPCVMLSQFFFFVAKVTRSLIKTTHFLFSFLFFSYPVRRFGNLSH